MTKVKIPSDWLGLIIKVKGGNVIDVKNMPKGYEYIIEDEDITEEECYD